VRSNGRTPGGAAIAIAIVNFRSCGSGSASRSSSCAAQIASRRDHIRGRGHAQTGCQGGRRSTAQSGRISINRVRSNGRAAR